jgi:hypothetical protein
MIGGPIKGADLMANFQLGDNQSSVLRINPSAVDKKGNPAKPIDAGSVTYLVDNPAIVALGAPAADTMSIPFSAVGPLSGNSPAATISFTATAGGQPVSGIFTIDITSEGPAALVAAADTPTEQP